MVYAARRAARAVLLAASLKSVTESVAGRAGVDLLVVEQGDRVAEEVCRRLGVTEQTFYRWKERFTGLGPAGVARAPLTASRKQQVEAGRRLTLDRHILQEIVAKKL